jgi:hypothetical protein
MIMKVLNVRPLPQHAELAGDMIEFFVAVES